MENYSRSKKSIINAKINFICYFISLIISFFSRKIFIEQLGIEFIGLTGTLQSLLGFLNLAELGIGTAIGYVLYRPIFHHDKTKINEIISVFGYIYRCIGIIILTIACILSCFLPLIFSTTNIPSGIIFFAYYSFLTSSLITYFINYRQTLLSADQRNYIITSIYQIINSLKVIIQMIVVLYFCSYITWISIELFFGIIYSFFLNKRISKTYPWLKSEISLGKKLFRKYPDITKYTKQLFVHKIGSFTQSQLMPILIYSFTSLSVVTLYGNYTIIISKIIIFVTSVFSSTSAGVGNLISEGNKSKILKVYKEMFAIRFFTSGIIVTGVFFLINPFIALWLGFDFILSKTILILIVITLIFIISRGTTDEFIFGYGLFYDIWAPIAESLIFVVVSLFFGSIYGLVGVLLGPVISLFLIVYLWKPYFLFKKGFNVRLRNYIMIFLQNFFPFIISFFIMCMISNKININPYSSFVNWFLYAIVFVFLYGIIAFSLQYMMSSGLRNFVIRLVGIGTKNK
jgi:O-antigen/teichoic acid export membrane protein